MWDLDRSRRYENKLSFARANQSALFVEGEAIVDVDVGATDGVEIPGVNEDDEQGGELDLVIAVQVDSPENVAGPGKAGGGI